MTFTSYSLSPSTMINLMRLVDTGRVTITGLPKRNEASAAQRFIKDYIREKSSK